MVTKHRVKTDLRKQQRFERLNLLALIDSTSDVEKLLNLQEQLLELTNRHRAEKEGRFMPKLSIEEYRDLQAQGLKDKAIAKRVGMPITSLYTFKHANGLTTKRKPSKEPVVVKNDAPEVVVPVVEPVVEVVEKTPYVAHVEMPAIETDWAPKLQSSIDSCFDTHAEKSVELKATVGGERTVFESPVQTDREQLILQQYALEEAQRETELWKSRFKDMQSKFFEQCEENRKADTDLRSEMRENKRLQDMLDKMKQTKLLNYLLMKDSVSMIEQLDTVAEKKEVGAFVWR